MEERASHVAMRQRHSEPKDQMENFLSSSSSGTTRLGRLSAIGVAVDSCRDPLPAMADGEDQGLCDSNDIMSWCVEQDEQTSIKYGVLSDSTKKSKPGVLQLKKGST